MGESKLKLAKREERLLSCTGVQTMAGRVQVRWDTKSAATPMGQLAYFIEFLTLTGLWARWLESCPLRYSSPNAPSKAEVLGTWLLSILSGHQRYAHVTAIRCDGVNPGLLEMKKVISEDALRNASSARLLFASMYGNRPDLWSADLAGTDRLRFITNCLTRLRFCHTDGRLDLQYKGTVAQAPATLLPWFRVPGAATTALRRHAPFAVGGPWSKRRSQGGPLSALSGWT